MFEYSASDVLRAALPCALIALLIVRRQLGLPLALLLVALRFGITTVYFIASGGDGWLLLDDVTYYEQGLKLQDFGGELWYLFFDPYGRETLAGIAGSSHFFYTWWAGLTMYLLGPYYFVPVLVNVTVSFLTARIIWRLALRGGFSESYARGLLIFALIHWDIIAWSSFINLKDNLIVCLTVWLIALVSSLTERGKSLGRSSWLVGQFALCGMIFFNFRFYVPFLLLSAILLWSILKLRGKLKWSLLVVTAVALHYSFEVVRPALEQIAYVPDNAILSLGRALLSPLPWSVDPEYSFLLIPAFLHLVTVPAAAIGGVSLYRRGGLTALLVTYLLFVILLITLQPEYFGPRHRFQVVFCLLWMQFEGLAWLVRRRGNPVTAPIDHHRRIQIPPG